MADLNFPVSPVSGQTYTSGQTTWTYDSTFGVWNITSSGPTGYTGSFGYTGSQGIQGVIGYTGSQGIQGVIGYTGSRGFFGYTGSQGDQGIIGYTGSQGDIGYTGSAGYAGSNGADGYTGSEGYTGSVGLVGYTGSQGPAGSPNYSDPTFTGAVYLNGSVRGSITALASSAVDCSLGNYFTRTVTGASSWTVTNIPSSRYYSFILELTNGGTGSQTWFSNTRWPGGSAPTLTVSGTDLLGFVTDDGGANWRGVMLMKDSK